MEIAVLGSIWGRRLAVLPVWMVTVQLFCANASSVIGCWRSCPSSHLASWRWKHAAALTMFAISASSTDTSPA